MLTNLQAENKVWDAPRFVKFQAWFAKNLLHGPYSGAQTPRNKRELFVRLGAKSSGDASGDAIPRFSKMRRRRMNIDRGVGGFSQRSNAGILKGAQKIRHRQSRFAKGAMMFEHPPSQHRFGCLFKPLIDQYGDFTAQVGSMIKPSEFKTLKGRIRSATKIVDGWNDARYRHGQTPMWTG